MSAEEPLEHFRLQHGDDLEVYANEFGLIVLKADSFHGDDQIIVIEPSDVDVIFKAIKNVAESLV